MLVRWLSPLLAIPLLAATCGPGTRHPARQVEATEVAVVIPSASAPGGAYTLMVDATEVTQREYQARMGTNPARHDDCPDCPVEGVSWYDAARFANARSAEAGLEACYTLVGCDDGSEADDAEPRRRRRWRTYGLRCASAESRGPACTGYRLPTRPESDVFRRLETLDERAGVVARSAVFGRGGRYAHTLVVGGRRPNGLGLFDTYGNVEEWLDDPASTPADARRPDADETQWYGVVGGCAFSSLRDLRNERWRAMPAARRRNCVGFRLVRTR